jgi:hypothetical protein
LLISDALIGIGIQPEPVYVPVQRSTGRKPLIPARFIDRLRLANVRVTTFSGFCRFFRARSVLTNSWACGVQTLRKAESVVADAVAEGFRASPMVFNRLITLAGVERRVDKLDVRSICAIGLYCLGVCFSSCS